MAHRTSDTDAANGCRRRAHLGEALSIASPSQLRNSTEILTRPQNVFDVERAHVDDTGQRTRTASRRHRTALNIDTADQSGIDIREPRCLMTEEAEILPSAIDRHVDTAVTLEAAYIDGNTGVLRADAREGAGLRAQRVIEIAIAVGRELVARDNANAGRRVVGRIGVLHRRSRILRNRRLIHRLGRRSLHRLRFRLALGSARLLGLGALNVDARQFGFLRVRRAGNRQRGNRETERQRSSERSETWRTVKTIDTAHRDNNPRCS